jgi:hypothetical protein
MLIMKDMSTGEVDIEESVDADIGPGDADTMDEYEDALSSGWNPAMAEVIHRELDHYEISQAESPMPSDLNDVDIDAFLNRMYTYMD